MEIVVPNPKREVRTNSNIELVRNVLKSLPKYVAPTALTIENDTINFYQFKAPATGIFSLGMLLQINVNGYFAQYIERVLTSTQKKIIKP